jgi:hypothetical protein
MKYYRVAISAGHHPAKQGAVWHGVTEFDETQYWQDEIIRQLETENKKRAHGVEIIPERIGWNGLTRKVREINQLECNLAIEVHFNACGDPTVRGCETLYFPGSEAGLAAGIVIQNPLAAAMQTKSRGVKPGWYRMDRPGVVDFYGDEDGDEMPDYFLRATNCTSLILEPEFLSQIEYIRLRRKAGCFAIAKAITSLAGALLNEPEKEGPTEDLPAVQA